MFGASYAIHGTTLLRMLLLSLPGIAVSFFYSAFAWLDRNVWRLAVRDLVTAVIYFGILLTLIGHFGILAIGIASLVTSGLQGIFFLPIAIKRYRATAPIAVPRDRRHELRAPGRLNEAGRVRARAPRRTRRNGVPTPWTGQLLRWSELRADVGTPPRAGRPHVT